MCRQAHFNKAPGNKIIRGFPMPMNYTSISS